MKRFLKIIDSRWLIPGKEMLYEDEDGDTFVGPPITYVIGDMIIVEASDGPQEDGHYHIVRVIGTAKNKQGKFKKEE